MVANPHKKISLVLIHGWGCDQSSWQPLIVGLEQFASVISIELPGFGRAPVIDDYSLDNVLSILAKQIPDKSWVMGWSLGAMLAVQLADRLAGRYPQKIIGIINLAANAKFVADDSYSDAMLFDVNQNFNQSFKDNPAPTLKLFSGLLAQGANDERALLKQMRQLLQAEKINASWYQALLLLSRIDNRQALQKTTQPCLHLLADKDSLVPVSAAVQLKNINMCHQVEVIAQSSHALHWCAPELILNIIQDFIHVNTPADNNFKSHLAKNFSKAVLTYDSAAEIQRKAGSRLLNEFISGIDLNESSVAIDLGCGTGFFLNELREKFGRTDFIGVDLSLAMLKSAEQKSSGLLINGDAEYLPFADNSIDFIYSNFSLQWCFDLPSLFDELWRVMKPEAELVFTTLGSKSLCELNAAWESVDNQSHINTFVDQSTLIDLLEARFSKVMVDSQLLQAKFDSVPDVLRSLKSVGATYHTPAAKGLMGRKKFAQLIRAYETFRVDGKLALSYDVIFVRVKKHE